MSKSKISLYSLTELKTTCDDHLPIFLSSATTPSAAPLARERRFKPAYNATHIRLALGYTAVAIALYIFYLDYYLKQDFSETKQLTLYAVVAYFVLNGALTAWIWLGEAGLVFEGSRKEKAGSNAPVTTTQLRIRSHPPHRKYDPSYRITADWKTGSAATAGKTEATAPFTQFFSADGFFVPGEFENWLCGQISIVNGGRAAAPPVKPETLQGGGEDALEADGDTIVVERTPVKDQSGPSNPFEVKKARGRPKKGHP